MNRRLFRKWVRWLLPLLVVRAFLPVGFMLGTTQADGLQLAFCPDQAPIVQGLDHAATGHSDHAAGNAGGSHSGPQHNAHLDPPCPFAVAAVAAVIDLPHLGAVASPAAEEVLPERPVAVPLAGRQRADRIRGPPSLS
jgi:hypothetical protein